MSYDKQLERILRAFTPEEASQTSQLTSEPVRRIEACIEIAQKDATSVEALMKADALNALRSIFKDLTRAN